MFRPRLLPLLALSSLLLIPELVRATADFPQPSPYPTTWQLTFKHGLPKRVVVDIPSIPVPKAYWYMTYTVVNNTDREQMFLPKFELLSEDGQISRSDVDIPKAVFNKIKEVEGNKYMEPITTLVGQIRLGEAEARDGVAIWPEPSPRMGHFSVFVTGLSGEAVTMKIVNGEFKKIEDAAEMKDPKQLVILRKTLRLNFFIRGDEVYPGEDEVNQAAEEWIMR